MGGTDQVRISPGQCPHCGKRLDAVSRLEGPVTNPSAGDLTVCFGCGESLQFDDRLRLKRISATELAALDPEEAADLNKTQAVIRAFLRDDR